MHPHVVPVGPQHRAAGALSRCACSPLHAVRAVRCWLEAGHGLLAFACDPAEVLPGRTLSAGTPILTHDFAGIGTRRLSAQGAAAILEVYRNTFRGTAASGK